MLTLTFRLQKPTRFESEDSRTIANELAIIGLAPNNSDSIRQCRFLSSGSAISKSCSLANKGVLMFNAWSLDLLKGASYLSGGRRLILKPTSRQSATSPGRMNKRQRASIHYTKPHSVDVEGYS
jgi:hypothetical protein